MRRCLGKACAGVLMLAAAGCLDSFLSFQVVVPGPKVIVPGTVSEVSAKLLEGLGEIVLPPKRVGPEYRIAGQSKSGICFCLHLYPKKEKNAKVKKTEVRVRWDRGGDKELWQSILQILDVPDEADGAANSPDSREP